MRLAIDKVILDIRHDKKYAEHLFGTVGLRDLRVRPLFFSTFSNWKEYEEKVAEEMTPGSILVSCRIFNPGMSDTEFNIGLPNFTNRPSEHLLTRLIIYLIKKGYNVKVNDIVTAGGLLSIPSSQPSFCLGISSNLIENDSGGLNIKKSNVLQSHLSGAYDALMS